MKNIKYILLSGFMTLGIISCVDMELEPRGLLDKNALFGNEDGVKKYFAGIYDYLPIEDFVYHPRNGFRWDNYWENHMTLAIMCGEMTGQMWGIEAAGGFEYMADDQDKKAPYKRIRDINEFIRDFPDYKDQFAVENTYNQLLGEAHVFRAFFYFALVKRYGGVPIVKTVLDPTAPSESLQMPRDKESDVYRFIAEDLEYAMNIMPEPGNERGRINKYVAAALMSRAMLYAGSIAKYGASAGFTGEAVELGLVGIPSSEAEYFFQKAYDAAEMIEDSGKYDLYNGNGDKVQNYVDVFIEYTNEDIFVKDYNQTAPHNTRLKHSYDATHLPNPDFSSDNEAQSYPVYDMVKLYGDLPIVDGDGKPRRFANVGDVYANVEPRALATFYFPGMELRGNTFDVQRGLYVNFTGLATDAELGNNGASVNAESNRILQGPNYHAPETSTKYEYNGTKHSIAGRHGMWKDGHANNTRTGFYVRKYIDYRKSTQDVRLYTGEQPWKVFRYAEVLLNRAEAAYELGLINSSDALKREAFTYIAKIRQRAGSAVVNAYNSAPQDLSTLYGYSYDSNMKFIREERQRELMFENHRWWDLRRWRSAEAELKEFLPKVLMNYRVLSENMTDAKGETVKPMIWLEENEPWNKRFNFEKRYYYESIPGGEFNKNPNLYPQNPNY